MEQQHLPDSLKDKKFYFPGELGYEKQVNDRLKAWNAIKKSNKSCQGEAGLISRHVVFPCGDIQLEGDIAFTRRTMGLSLRWLSVIRTPFTAGIWTIMW